MRQFLHIGSLLVLSFLCATPAFAQPETLVETGLQPVALLNEGERMHVICYRVDLNFDGMQDEGDSPACWYVVEAGSREATLMREFDWNDGLGFPVRPSLDPVNKLLFMPFSGEVRVYRTDDGSVNSPISLPWVAAAVYYDSPNGQALISQRRSPGLDVLRIVNVEDGSSETFETGENIQQTLVWYNEQQQRKILVLNEGIFGEQNSTLTILDLENEPLKSEIQLGGTGNHLLLQEDLLYVTMNGDHTVLEIDLNSQSIVRTIDVGTSEFNGPRESVIVDGDLYVTTYNDDVRRIDLESGELLAILTTDAKPEGITYREGRLWIANAFEPASFTSDMTVAVLHPKLSTEVVSIVNSALQPSYLHTGQDGVIAFCNQVDLNFNGAQDEGDLSQSIALYPAADQAASWQVDLPWGGAGFPLRPGLNNTTDFAYAVNGMQLWRQSLRSSDNMVLADIDLDGAVAVSVSDEGTHIAITERAAESGRVRIIELANPDNEQVIETSQFVQQTIWYEFDNGELSYDLVILDEGQFGGGTSRLLFAEIESEQVVEDVDLGEGGNHLLRDGELLYVTLGSSHQVVLFDLDELSVRTVINTQTEGFNGPRESVLFNGDLFVSTYSSDVRRFNTESGDMVARYETGGKPEGITVYNDQIWVANAFEFDAFASGSSIAVLEPTDAITSVDEPGRVESAVRYDLTLAPNPAVNKVNVRFEAGAVSDPHVLLDLRSVDGRLLKQQSLEIQGGQFDSSQMDLRGLASGAYIVTVRSDDRVFSAPLIIRH